MEVCLEILKSTNVMIGLFVMEASFICSNLEALRLKLSNYDAFRGSTDERKAEGSLSSSP